MLRETGSLSFLNNILRAGILTAVIFAVVLFVSAKQADAQLDPSFGTNGVSTVVVPGNGEPVATFVLAGGKILVLSRNKPFTNQHATYDFVRLNADGSVDGTYGSGGVVHLPIPFITTGQFEARDIISAFRQADGKIILVGIDNNDGLVLRFNEDGTFDNGFSGDGIHPPNISGGDVVSSGLVQSDGGIVVAGSCGGGMFLVRYNANGAVDTSFGDLGGVIIHGGIMGGNPFSLQMQSTGKIVAGINGSVRRFNSNGTIDNSFTTITTSYYYTMRLQPDDKIITAWKINKVEPLERTNTDPLVSRFNPEGTVDSGFGTAGTVTFDLARYIDDDPLGLNILSDGQILVSSATYIPPNRSKYKDVTSEIARLSTTGAVTGKFLISTFRGASQLNVLVLSDGRVLLSGSAFNWDMANPSYDLQLAQITGVPTESYRFKNSPFDFAFKNDGVADATVFRPSDLNWYPNSVFPGYLFGSSGDILAPADYIGKDFAADLAVFRPSNGTWYIAMYATGGPSDIIAAQWGQNGDIPAPADYDGDAKADLAVFRPSTGAWYIRNSADNSVTALYWGVNGDKPVPGDFDGDGRDDIAAFRPSNGTWYIIRSTDGLLFVNFGLNGDVPVQEDYDGDGKADIAIWRPSSGVWYRINSSDSSIGGMQWGLPDDRAVPGRLRRRL